jgi:hypothetical protein
MINWGTRPPNAPRLPRTHDGKAPLGNIHGAGIGHILERKPRHHPIVVPKVHAFPASVQPMRPMMANRSRRKATRQAKPVF